MNVLENLSNISLFFFSVYWVLWPLILHLVLIFIDSFDLVLNFAKENLFMRVHRANSLTVLVSI